MLLYIKEKVFYNFTKGGNKYGKTKNISKYINKLIALRRITSTEGFSCTCCTCWEWTDYAAGSFASGKGTKEDPYIINSPEQLAIYS